MKPRARGSLFLACVHGGHFFGHVGFEFLVFFIVRREFVEHVVRILVFPVLLGIVVGQFSGLALLVLLVSRIGQRWIFDDGSAGKTAFDKVSGSDGIFADGHGMFLAVNFAADGDVANFAAFGGHREEVLGKLGQRFALVVVGFFVDVN